MLLCVLGGGGMWVDVCMHSIYTLEWTGSIGLRSHIIFTENKIFRDILNETLKSVQCRSILLSAVCILKNAQYLSSRHDMRHCECSRKLQVLSAKRKRSSVCGYKLPLFYHCPLKNQNSIFLPAGHNDQQACICRNLLSGRIDCT